MNRERNLDVETKTGFHNDNPHKPILIVDERGIPFYDTRFLETQPAEFNLPSGKYGIRSGSFREMVRPVEYSLAPMPREQRRRREDPAKFDIVFTDNPYKCTIDWDSKCLYFDHKLEQLPLPNLIYVLFHEYGHRYYGCNCGKANCKKCDIAEKGCDRYAQNRMLERGYNPEQIGEGIIGTLSSRQYDRKEKVVDSLIEGMNTNNYSVPVNGQDHLDACENDEPGNYETSLVAQNGDNLDYTTTPSKDWSCIDWAIWHQDMLKAFQDGRLANFSFDKALNETNSAFAYHWKRETPFSFRFWGTCGYDSGFYDYFKSIGYTDHISFLAGVITPLLSGTTSVASGASEVVKSAESIISGKAFLPVLLVGGALLAYSILK